MARRAGFDAVLAFPAMRVGVCAAQEAVTLIEYLPPAHPLISPRTRLAERAARQIERYRADPEFAFDLPLTPSGTSFQQRVWRGMCAIALGHTLTYGELARRLRSAPRAVGQACGANPYPLVVPCHRVVAANGLGGFAHARGGYLLDAKRWLLNHEGALR